MCHLPLDHRQKFQTALGLSRPAGSHHANGEAAEDGVDGEPHMGEERAERASGGAPGCELFERPDTTTVEDKQVAGWTSQTSKS